jgi:nickel-dependent lactate racemase
MVIGNGYADRCLTEEEVRDLAARALAEAPLDGKRVIVIIPDGTRTAPIPLMFRIFHELLGGRVAALDYLIALGTHQPMNEEAIAKLVGVTAEDREVNYPKVRIFNHRWDLPETFVTLGRIDSDEISRLTGGQLDLPVDVRLNRMVLDYDQIII